MKPEQLKAKIEAALPGYMIIPIDSLLGHFCIMATPKLEASLQSKQEEILRALEKEVDGGCTHPEVARATALAAVKLMKLDQGEK